MANRMYVSLNLHNIKYNVHIMKHNVHIIYHKAHIVKQDIHIIKLKMHINKHKVHKCGIFFSWACFMSFIQYWHRIRSLAVAASITGSPTVKSALRTFANARCIAWSAVGRKRLVTIFLDG